MTEILTEDERKAIMALHRLAKKWPKSLSLFSMNGSLVVMKLHPDHPEDTQGRIVQQIIGIENDGGDPDFKWWDDESEIPEWGTKEYMCLKKKTKTHETRL